MPTTWLTPTDPVPDGGFRPLERLATAVDADPDLPSVNPDHFLYAARVEREGGTPLHAYRHIGSRRFLVLDDDAQPWRYAGRDRDGTECYAPFATVADALAAADLVRGNLVAGHLRPRGRTGRRTAGPPRAPADRRTGTAA